VVRLKRKVSFEHKAFVLDYEKFESQLKNILEAALEDENVSQLAGYISQNQIHLKDPYEGEPLTDEWESMIESPDPHQYGDFALTMFYNPSEDIGLGYDWEDVQETLSQRLTDVSLVLGSPIGPESNYFDPGKMGAYFQSPQQVIENQQLLESCFEQEELESSAQLEKTLEIFQAATSEGKGLYITF
jgi:hypothetical protein